MWLRTAELTVALSLLSLLLSLPLSLLQLAAKAIVYSIANNGMEKKPRLFQPATPTQDYQLKHGCILPSTSQQPPMRQHHLHFSSRAIESRCCCSVHSTSLFSHPQPNLIFPPVGGFRICKQTSRANARPSIQDSKPESSM